MTNAELIEQTRRLIEQKFSDETSGHDYAHMYRVWQLSRHIAEGESNVDQLSLELGALLHDIADSKFTGGDDTVGPRVAREWLESLKTDEATIVAVEHIIANISFHSSLKEDRPALSLEAQIVHDADKLDAIGAIGIARTFVYSGSKARPMYDPALKPIKHNSVESYQKSGGTTTINHFYEKLLLLKDMMLTNTGRQVAAHRHTYMEQFLDEFFAEWEGKK